VSKLFNSDACPRPTTRGPCFTINDWAGWRTPACSSWPEPPLGVQMAML
jgi:hypothetical protein